MKSSHRRPSAHTKLTFPLGQACVGDLGASQNYECRRRMQRDGRLTGRWDHDKVTTAAGSQDKAGQIRQSHRMNCQHVGRTEWHPLEIQLAEPVGGIRLYRDSVKREHVVCV